MPRRPRSAVLALGVVLLVGPPSAPAGIDPACPVSAGVPCEDAGKAGVRCQTEAGESEFASVDAYCLSCHGVTAPRRLCSGVRPAPHSSAIPYPADTRDLRPLSALDPRLRLRGGQVTCETCHRDPTAAFYLSIPVAASALCLACHLK